MAIEMGKLMATGTREDPWELKTPPGTSSYTMYRDEQADPPTLVCQVGSTTLKYQLRAIDDLHAWLAAQGDWVPLGAADEKKPAADGTVEAWGRSADNPVGGWYGLRSGYRGRFGMYLPPLLEELGLAEVSHDPRNNRMRGIYSPSPAMWASRTRSSTRWAALPGAVIRVRSCPWAAICPLTAYSARTPALASWVTPVRSATSGTVPPRLTESSRRASWSAVVMSTGPCTSARAVALSAMEVSTVKGGPAGRPAPHRGPRPGSRPASRCRMVTIVPGARAGPLGAAGGA